MNICYYSDLLSWVNDKMRVMMSVELGKDLSGAESLLQRHKERKVCFQYNNKEPALFIIPRFIVTISVKLISYDMQNIFKI